MKYYELMFILRSELEEAQQEDVLKKINTVLEKNNFSIIRQESRGVQKLAYEIQKEKSGNYFLYYVKTENSHGVKDASESLNIIPKILRYIFIKKEKIEEEAEK
ncbi:MAG: 30S ribosomal protein S6 [Candidatus Muiribacteriota bacterium]